jgi:hypothetical protein
MLQPPFIIHAAIIAEMLFVTSNVIDPHLISWRSSSGVSHLFGWHFHSPGLSFCR